MLSTQYLALLNASVIEKLGVTYAALDGLVAVTMVGYQVFAKLVLANGTVLVGAVVVVVLVDMTRPLLSYHSRLTTVLLVVALLALKCAPKE